MPIQKLPLRDRLGALSAGRPAHPEYAPAVLQAMAELPITAILSGYPTDLERLADLVRYPVQHLGDLSCRDMAIRVQDMRRQGIPIGEVLNILAKPYIDIYRHHLERMARK